MILSEAGDSGKNSASALNHQATPNVLNLLVSNEGGTSDLLDNRQTPGSATELLPSPTLPRDSNDNSVFATPLKIFVKKATKYLGLSKSLGIKVSLV